MDEEEARSRAEQQIDPNTAQQASGDTGLGEEQQAEPTAAQQGEESIYEITNVQPTDITAPSSDFLALAAAIGSSFALSINAFTVDALTDQVRERFTTPWRAPSSKMESVAQASGDMSGQMRRNAEPSDTGDIS